MNMADMKIRVLLIEDDKVDQKAFERLVKEKCLPYEYMIAGSVSEAIRVLNSEEFDIIITDYLLGDGTAFDIFDYIINTPIIFVTGAGDEETAVKAMKAGAYDYLIKDSQRNYLSVLSVTVENALKQKLLKSENILLKQQVMVKNYSSTLIGTSKKIKDILDIVKRVASSKATVLIQGESGTGKELVANIIHYNSSVSGGPFIKVNCSALAEGVLESELFGHEKGAFTGALFTKKGRFELAHGGTLFLDEIGDLPPSFQVKLLRFLQESEFERVGGTKTLKVDVRIVTATNKNLEELVKEEKFRDDLFFRLKVVSIDVPPLRERKGDIPEIINYHLNRFIEIHGKKIKGITPDAMKLIISYSWPGNIRELINCIESAVVMSLQDEITVDSLPSYIRSKKTGESSGKVDENLSEIEKKAIIAALKKTGGKKTEAAKILGIAERTLYRKLKQFKEFEDNLY
jgi:DNA-binding NtrC family response regulator